jgi:hypothetical protein
MIDANQIREHMEIKGSDGQHVGTVDRVEGQRIKLTKGDSGGHGHHHYIEMSMVEEIKGGAVCLNSPAEQVKQNFH